MKVMTRLLILLTAIGVILGVSSQGLPNRQISAHGDPTVAEILNRYLQAIGGRAAFQKINTRVMKGTYAWPTKGTTAPIEVYAKAPDKYAFYFTGPQSSAARGFNGKTGWSRDYSEAGLRILDGVDLMVDRREADFYQEIRLGARYRDLSFSGKTKIDEREVYVVTGTPVFETPPNPASVPTAFKGKPETLYFEVASGLLVRRDCERYYSLTNVEIYYANYQEVEGVQLPFTIRIVRPSIPFMNILAFDEIKLNLKIDDQKFERPASTITP